MEWNVTRDREYWTIVNVTIECRSQEYYSVVVYTTVVYTGLMYDVGVEVLCSIEIVHGTY